MPSDILLYGAGSPLNFLYTYRGISQGKPYYTRIGREPGPFLSWATVRWLSGGPGGTNPPPGWVIYSSAGALAYSASNQIVDYPWQATYITSPVFGAQDPPPVVMEAGPYPKSLYAVPGESGSNRFRRLNSLGYV